MRLECIANTPAQLSSDRAKQAYDINTSQEEVYLEIGRRYFAYGIIFRNGENLPWFLVCEEGDEYPTPHLGDFFKIVDGEIPAGWVFTTSINNLGESGILPKRWATDPCFMEKMIDEDKEALNYFRQLKVNMGES